MKFSENSAETENPIFREGKRGLLQIVFGRAMLIAVLLLVQFLILFYYMFELAQYVPIVTGGTFVFTAVMLIYVLNTRDNPALKLSWCILIALLPAFGALLYFFVRVEVGHQTVGKMIAKSMSEGEEYLPEQPLLLEQIRQEDKDLYNLARYMRGSARASVYSNTQVQYFPSGEQKFEEMLRQLEQAEKYIFLEYFIIDESYMWNRILEVLARKAKEGVEVRVMYDGTAALALLPYQYPKRLEKMGIQCKMFSPLHPFVSTHYNNRDHRKILVIDGHTAFTGGINLQDRYINREQIHGHWKDTAVMLKGEGARGFALMFLQMWNHNERVRTYAPYLDVPVPHFDAPGYVIPYGDNPMDGENVGEMVYLNMLNQAKDYVYIMTPYLILDHEMVTAMRFAAKRGVDVRLILPHIPDKKMVFMLAKSHYRELAQAGVKIYEYTPGFVHAKVFLCDGREAVVGTINLDYRSLYLHFECAAYLYGVTALQDIRTDFEETMAKSELITMDKIHRQGPLTRFAGAILKALAPLL